MTAVFGLLGRRVRREGGHQGVLSWATKGRMGQLFWDLQDAGLDTSSLDTDRRFE